MKTPAELRKEFLRLFPSRNNAGKVAGDFDAVWAWVTKQLHLAQKGAVEECLRICFDSEILTCGDAIRAIRTRFKGVLDE